MCLILLGCEVHPRYHLVLATNRDEFYDRPTAPLDFWSDTADILAGRDLKRGGTWLGVTRSGRLAAVTNYRQPALKKRNAPSRGDLVSRFLKSTTLPLTYLSELRETARQYEGFNLIVADSRSLYCYSNVDDQIRTINSGIHGVSNHLLDTPWPKVRKGMTGLQRLLAEGKTPELQELFALLADRTRPPDHLLPNTGVSLEWERVLGPVFIASPDYGTRCSTVVLMEKDGRISVSERTFPAPCPTEQTRSFTRTISFMQRD